MGLLVQKPYRKNTKEMIYIKRTDYEDKQTLGNGTVVDNGKPVFFFKTLELPDRGNQKRISCIPKGRYNVAKRWSTKYGNHFHVLNVPNRSLILIHHGNYYKDTLGCILVGSSVADIDGDGYRDVTHSKQTMAQLNRILPDSFMLVVE